MAELPAPHILEEEPLEAAVSASEEAQESVLVVSSPFAEAVLPAVTALVFLRRAEVAAPAWVV